MRQSPGFEHRIYPKSGSTLVRCSSAKHQQGTGNLNSFAGGKRQTSWRAVRCEGKMRSSARDMAQPGGLRLLLLGLLWLVEKAGPVAFDALEMRVHEPHRL